ncbi:MAG: baseplate J/gp47 family protein [Comamonas sp.]
MNAPLPEPAVVEVLDFERIVSAIKADVLQRYPDIADVLALESDPIVKLLEAFAYRELLYRARVNDAARAHLLAFAADTDLDYLAATFGITRMVGEPDERLRIRVQLRIAALAGQGTKEHYELLAMSASLNVRAAFATQPRPGAVHVVVWLHDTALGTTAQVVDALNAENARMLGVPVTVGVATPRPIDVYAKIWRTSRASPALLANLQAQLAANLSATAALGRNMARSWVTTLLHVDGVAAVEYVGNDAPPATTQLAADEYPVLGDVQLHDMGVL